MHSQQENRAFEGADKQMLLGINCSELRTKILSSWLIISLFFIFGCGSRKETGMENAKTPADEVKEAKNISAIKEENKQINSQVLSADAGQSKKEEEVNPFLSQEELELFKDIDTSSIPIDYLNLTAIFYSPPDSKAVIEGRIYKKGDILDNKMITEIKPEEVFLEDTQSKYILRIKGVLDQ